MSRPEIAFVQLIDASGEAICIHATTWPDAIVELESGLLEKAANARLYDADRALIAEVPVHIDREKDLR